MDKNRLKQTWLNYFVAISLGVTFTLILLFITWNTAIDSKAREFELASSSIKDTVARNVQTANDSLNSLTSFLEVDPDLTPNQYSTISTSLMGLHPFMEGAVFLTKNDAVDGSEPGFSIRYQTMRSDYDIDLDKELLSEESFNSAINILFETDSVITLPSEFTSNGWRSYWILHAIQPDIPDSNLVSDYGFAAILINTNKLVGNNIGNTDLSIMLLSDSASLSGRQLLYQNTASYSDSWQASSFLEEGITQFPFYSVKLSVAKNVSWEELEKTMLFISTLIGMGITLLIVALVKSKDEQEQQLRERNIIIEAQVREQTEELAMARDQALEASLMKSSFLASMSHEIRTPLNAIIGMSDLLSETEMDFEQKKYVAVFKKAGDTLLSLVNDILDLSKIEANQLQLEEIEFNLFDTIEESVEIYALKAAEKSIELITNINPAVNPVRMGDPSRLRQVLLNLISNALKFTESGEISITINPDGEGKQDKLNISVKDSGTGIPGDKLEKIFESFSQADSSTTRKYGGTGLGLTISRRLVEMMDGKIWVESVEGEGSNFIVNVRLRVVEGHKDNSGIIKNLTGKVFIIDNNQHTTEVLATYLEAMGADTSTCTDHDQCLIYLQDEANRESIDLLIVDAEMPDMDGFSLVKKLQNSGINKPIIMMLNPSTLNQNQKNLDELGTKDSYLTKPVKLRELEKLVYSSLHFEIRENGATTAEKPDVIVKPLRILLVDDNPDNRLLVKAYLKKLPYELDEAENGEEAVAKFKGGGVDLVLMDVQMPVMDGREATRKIRALEKEGQVSPVPIIALTAHAIKEEIDLCLEAGCDTHLSKPVKKDVLINTIQSITGN